MADNKPAVPADDGDSALVRYLQGVSETAVEDPEMVAREVVKRILTATSIDDVLKPQTLIHAEDMLWVPIEVTDVRFNQSDKEGNLTGAYAVIDAKRMDTGQQVQISCGGQNVMAQLYQLKRLEALPLPVRLRQADKPTARGYYPLWLEAVTPDQVAATPPGEPAF